MVDGGRGVDDPSKPREGRLREKDGSGDVRANFCGLEL